MGICQIGGLAEYFMRQYSGPVPGVWASKTQGTQQQLGLLLGSWGVNPIGSKVTRISVLRTEMFILKHNKVDASYFASLFTSKTSLLTLTENSNKTGVNRKEGKDVPRHENEGPLC